MSPSTPRSSTPALALLALGVVYGDIGTSPLYAVKETFNPDHGIALTAANILGGLSAIFWALMIVVSLKYVVLVLRASNRGEGGIMALLALAAGAVGAHSRWRASLLVIGVFGAALFYGDAVLTPAISVLSAVEGLEVGTSALKPYSRAARHGDPDRAVPDPEARHRLRRAAVRAGLRALVRRARRRSEPGISRRTLASWRRSTRGMRCASRRPTVSPRSSCSAPCCSRSPGPRRSMPTWGTSASARSGSRGSPWWRPALVLNYFGQGALLIDNPRPWRIPSTSRIPSWALYPMVALATAATIIASQADDLRRVLDDAAGRSTSAICRA
jgi:KUP system potassium uptake protein